MCAATSWPGLCASARIGCSEPFENMWLRRNMSERSCLRWNGVRPMAAARRRFLHAPPCMQECCPPVCCICLIAPIINSAVPRWRTTALLPGGPRISPRFHQLRKACRFVHCQIMAGCLKLRPAGSLLHTQGEGLSCSYTPCNAALRRCRSLQHCRNAGFRNMQPMHSTVCEYGRQPESR